MIDSFYEEIIKKQFLESLHDEHGGCVGYILCHTQHHYVPAGIGNFCDKGIPGINKMPESISSS